MRFRVEYAIEHIGLDLSKGAYLFQVMDDIRRREVLIINVRNKDSGPVKSAAESDHRGET
jgi:hypothetical protein